MGSYTWWLIINMMSMMSDYMLWIGILPNILMDYYGLFSRNLSYVENWV